MKLKTIFLTMVLMLLFACKTNKVVEINTVNIKKSHSNVPYSALYVLPRTAIDVDIKIRKTKYRKGPYHRYAKSYLNIDNVINNDRDFWEIIDVKFSTHSLPDTNKVYVFESANEQSLVALELTNQGFIKSVFSDNLSPIKENKNKRNINKNKTKTKTNTNLMQSSDNKDFDFEDIRLPKSVQTLSTLQEQAIELSKKILSLREDRTAILIGDGYTEIMPEGKALKFMIKQIDVLQSQYISLFKGKEGTETFNYKYSYVPNNVRNLSQTILFRFSEAEGIVGDIDMNGNPVKLQIKSNGNLKAYKAFKDSRMFMESSSKNKNKNKGLHYNIPEMAIVSLIYADKELAKYQTSICQMGTVEKLPSDYLSGKYVIEFYSKLGSIKRIRKLNQE